MMDSRQLIAISRWRKMHADLSMPGVIAKDDLGKAVSSWLLDVRLEEAEGTCTEILFHSDVDAVQSFLSAFSIYLSGIWVYRFMPMDGGLASFISASEIEELLRLAIQEDADITLAPVSGEGVIGLSFSVTDQFLLQALLIGRGSFKQVIEQMAKNNGSEVFKGN